MSEKSILLRIEHDETGQSSMTGIYDDDLVELFKHGQVNITRASHVEPDDNGEWIADMSPSGGPKLGPYKLRETALAEEKKWLEAKLRS